MKGWLVASALLVALAAIGYVGVTVSASGPPAPKPPPPSLDALEVTKRLDAIEAQLRELMRTLASLAPRHGGAATPLDSPSEAPQREPEEPEQTIDGLHLSHEDLEKLGAAWYLGSDAGKDLYNVFVRVGKTPFDAGVAPLIHEARRRLRSVARDFEDRMRAGLVAQGYNDLGPEELAHISKDELQQIQKRNHEIYQAFKATHQPLYDDAVGHIGYLIARDSRKSLGNRSIERDGLACNIRLVDGCRHPHGDLGRQSPLFGQIRDLHQGNG
ncbi:MAG: hypothetical protein AB1486_02600 [Planctomycetota bacterium]